MPAALRVVEELARRGAVVVPVDPHAVGRHAPSFLATDWGAPREHLFAVAGGQTVEVTNMVELIQSGAGRVTMADDVARRFEEVTARCLWRPT